MNTRTALVTGAAGGIGSACVVALRQAGAHVVAVDRDAMTLSALAEETGCTPIALDLLTTGALQMMPTRVDILVNNAGIQHLAPVESFPPEEFSRMLDLMLTVPFRLIAHVLPGMYQRRWGRIVNISSIHGRLASPHKCAYVAAKHGLEGLSKVVALEAGGRGITSNAVSPAYVRTKLVEEQVAAQAMANGLHQSEVLDEIFLRRSSVKRLIEPSEVAELVVYLCRPEASYINGASFAIDGGWTSG